MIFSKEMINFNIFIFILIVIILLICFSLYYTLPNNYIFYDNILDDVNPLRKIKINIKANDVYILKYCKYKDVIIKFITNEDNYPIKISLDNIFKSQNLCIKKNTFIQITNNSNLNIINKTNKDIKIELYLYSIEYKKVSQ
jgi:hypothetical protein